jgi:hypothetical protein
MITYPYCAVRYVPHRLAAGALADFDGRAAFGEFAGLRRLP